MSLKLALKIVRCKVEVHSSKHPTQIARFGGQLSTTCLTVRKQYEQCYVLMSESILSHPQLLTSSAFAILDYTRLSRAGDADVN